MTRFDLYSLLGCGGLSAIRVKRDFHAHIWPEHWRRIWDRHLHLNRIFLKAGPRQNANNTSLVGFAGRRIQGNIDMLSDADSAGVALRYINPGLDLRGS
jgi:hypothetical protein